MSRPTDQEVHDQQEAEKAADREEHNRRTGGGKYPQKYVEHAAEDVV